MMKYAIVLIACLNFFNVRSATILLSKQDSIINPLIFSKNFGKTIYGRSAVFISGQKKFILGLFDCNSNDSLDAIDVISISEMKGNSPTLFTCADKLNSNYAGKLKFILIETNAYKVVVAALNEINIDRTQIKDDIKQYNYIDYLFSLSQFKSILMDSTAANIDSTTLANFNGKTTIIYYTASHCAPCEKLKPLITELLTSKNINLIIVSNNQDKSNKDFRTYKNRYYFDGLSDQSKARNYGFPQIVVFDRTGRFIESDNNLKLDQLFRKYAFPN